jgi:hypothetical protein
VSFILRAIIVKNSGKSIVPLPGIWRENREEEFAAGAITAAGTRGSVARSLVRKSFSRNRKFHRQLFIRFFSSFSTRNSVNSRQGIELEGCHGPCESILSWPQRYFCMKINELSPRL